MQGIRAWERAAGAMSIGAGLVHGGLGPEHFAQWWGYGLVFAGAAVAQLLLGLALLTDAVDPRRLDALWTKRWIYAVGCVGQLSLIGLYIITRTSGIPVIGPEAGIVEPIAPIDLVAKGLEVGCAFILGSLALREPPQQARARTG